MEVFKISIVIIQIDSFHNIYSYANVVSVSGAELFIILCQYI